MSLANFAGQFVKNIDPNDLAAIGNAAGDVAKSAAGLAATPEGQKAIAAAQTKGKELLNQAGGPAGALAMLQNAVAPADAQAAIPTATPVAVPSSSRAITEPESRTIANLVQAGTPLPTAFDLATAGAVRLPDAPTSNPLTAITDAFKGAGRRTYRKGRKDGKKSRKGRKARKTPRKTS